MASISSAGNFTIPAAQPSRRQAERSVTATESEKAVKQEQQVQRVNDEKSAQANASQQASGEQQKIEVAQQEAQRAEFDQQAGNVRNAEPNDVRPSSQTIQLSQTDSATSEQTQNKRTDNARVESNNVQRETASANKSAIDTFNQFQNINAAPRQGQELNRFV
jgi:hypothetical protein